jgi:hypothetical protein
MGVFNKKREKLVINKVKLCKNVFCQSKGLMFSKKPDFGLVFVFKSEKRRSLHMFFVFYPIDVLFLGSDKKVVEIKESFMPFAVYYPRKKSKFVIELPSGAIKKSETQVGDTISF